MYLLLIQNAEIIVLNAKLLDAPSPLVVIVLQNKSNDLLQVRK
jgi:hypothetical protein